jgi:hypothetical protein
MSIYRLTKRWTAVALAGAALVADETIGPQALAKGSGGRSASVSAHNQGYPDAVPPILPTESPSELAQLEASEREQFSHSDHSNAPYNDVDMNAFSSEGYVLPRPTTPTRPTTPMSAPVLILV